MVPNDGRALIDLKVVQSVHQPLELAYPLLDIPKTLTAASQTRTFPK
jgi:hypothetical protein